MPKFRDLFKTDELAVLLNVAHTAINHPVASLVLKHEMRGSDTSFHYWKATIQRMYEAAAEIGEAELKRQAAKEEEELDININEFLSFADLLTAFEVARMVLADEDRREHFLDLADVTNEDADETLRGLTRMMNSIRAHTQRQIKAKRSAELLVPPQLPALESGSNADIS
jgi:hypothetical protein